MLIILEMANNHQGDVELGKRIIREHAEVTKKYPQFQYAFKFQYRDLPTFIHHSADENHKYVKRFRQTNLSRRDRLVLKQFAEGLGFMTACTPFDEQSVIDVADHGYDILKVGSPSFSDWKLWDCIFKVWRGPIIASVGGATTRDMDYVVGVVMSFARDLTLMHCVSEYPTKEENLQLNQIDWLTKRYPYIPIGYSSHCPTLIDIDAVVHKNVVAIERHVCVEPKPNGYSLNPEEVDMELSIIDKALEICGVKDAHWNGPIPELFKRKEIGGRMWWKP